MTGFFDYLNLQFSNFLTAFPLGVVSVLALYTIIVVLSLGLSYLAIRLMLIIHQARQEFTVLEVKPLRVTEQSPLTTQQLFSVIHGLAKQQPFIYRLFKVTKTYSFEILSTKEDGIKYLVRVDKDDANLIKKTLLSYLPGISVNQTNDYLPLAKSAKVAKTLDFKLSRHFAFPLRQQEALEKHDPIAYLTGSMTQLDEDELISFQLVLSPLSKSSVPEIKFVSQLIYSGKDLSANIADITARLKRQERW
jgi:hypothetical protein